MKSFQFVVLALLTAVPSTFAATVPYTNDFSGSGSNTAFTTEATDAEWTVSGGSYVFNYTNTTVTPSIASVALTDAANTSFVMETQFTINSTGTVNSNGATLGLAAFGLTNNFGGSSTASAYYLADWQVANTSSPGNLRILALGDTTGYTNTPVTVDDNAGSTSLAANLSTTYTLRLTGTFVGATLNMSLGIFDTLGNQIGASAIASDTSPLTGTNFGYRNRVGISGGAFNAGFDNFSVITAVPEPATLGLLAAGSLALLTRRRRAAM